MTMKVAVLIPAAGSSTRYKGKKKKQFIDLDGRAVFLRTIEAFADRDDVSQIILAIPAEDEELFNIKWQAKLIFHGVKVIIGGDQRHQTIQKMLEQVNPDTDLIALHDAVRPCVTQDQITRVFDAALKSGAAILAAPLVGTIKKSDDNADIVQTLDRSNLWEAQTPQVFTPDLLKKAYDNKPNVTDPITDDAQLVEALGHKVKIVESDPGNLKITTGIDMTIASSILKSITSSKASAKPLSPFEEAQW